VLQFHYYYSTYDSIADKYDDPGYDFAGFLRNGNFVRFTDTIEPLASRVPYVNPDNGALLGPGVLGSNLPDIYFGDLLMPIVLGEVFGFRVGSQDNLFLPGVLTLSNINFTPNASITEVVTPTPEPGSWPLMLVAIGGAFAARRRMVRASNQRAENQ